ncbi:MAG: dihydrolipoyl dehydrogenase [Oscillospiraceae bacterium]|nr:dihydrolipoyl dehydrogenase [Oscillospiraceae bacterium]MCL2278984.1 dihydrolipoyl dehydrogenase [Oscillospiraceae bacterium]
MAAERAGHAGLSVLLVEKRALGGVCLNEGCIPSKALLNSAKIADYALHAEDYGVTIPGAKIDHSAVIKRKNKVVKTLVGGVKALMKANKVTVIDGEAFIVDKSHVKVGDEVYEGARLMIATGSVPIVPPIDGVKEGLTSGFVLTSREILDLENVPENLVIIGGGIIGLEMAAYYNTAGANVTVVEMMPKIAGAMDEDISSLLMKSLEKRGVKFLLSSKVTAVNERRGTVLTDRETASLSGGKGRANAQEKGTVPLSADKVLLSIGRKPLIEGFGLENTDVLIDNGAIKTDLNGLTNIPNIYAVGDVNGKYMLAHAAYREAEVAVNHMLGKRDIMRYDAIASVIYTSPEVASVGETEKTAKSKGIDFSSVTVPMLYSGRYVAESTAADGICKVLSEKSSRRIIGVHLYGSYASEIIVSACMMIEMQMRIDDAKEIVFPHPTVSEIIREAVFRL